MDTQIDDPVPQDPVPPIWLGQTYTVNGLRVVGKKLRPDQYGNYYFQLAEFRVGYRSVYYGDDHDITAAAALNPDSLFSLGDEPNGGKFYFPIGQGNPTEPDYPQRATDIAYSANWCINNNALIVLGSFGSPDTTLEGVDMTAYQEKAMKFVLANPHIVDAVWSSYDLFADPHTLLKSDGSGDLSPDGTLFTSVMNQPLPSTHVDIEASDSRWNSAFTLDANSSYIIIPDARSLYTIHQFLGTQIPTAEDFHGQGPMDGNVIGIPAQVQLGGLAVVVWHNTPTGGADPEIFSFPPGTSFAEASIGPAGGSIEFVICAQPGTYADNTGTCGVDIVRTE